MDLRRSRVAAWGLLLMMGQNVSSQLQPAATKAHGGVTLSASAALEAAVMVVTYHIANESEQAIVVWDQMIGYDAQGEKIDPAGAYVFWEQPDGVRLVRAQLQLPPGIDVYQKEVPYARTIPPHASVDGAIRLALPLHEASPFYSPPEFWDVVPCKRLRLLIGWREVLPGMKLVQTMVRGVKVESIQGRGPSPNQHLLDTSMEIATRLKIRRNDFDRRLPMN